MNTLFAIATLSATAICGYVIMGRIDRFLDK